MASAEPGGLRAALSVWVTLRQADLPERISYAREPQKLPVVRDADEVVQFLEAVSGLKACAALTTAYAAALRASEVANLKVGEVDSSRIVICIEQGATCRSSRMPRTCSSNG